MTRVLVAEDDERISHPLCRDLARSGYVAELARDGEEAWRHLYDGGYELAVLDVMLPRLSGLALCQRMRAQGMGLPVLLLTALGGEEDKVRGLDGGADDYLVKPFSLKELHARLRALLRRPPRVASARLAWGPLEVEVSTRQAFVGQTPVHLTPREFQLLKLLLESGAQPLSAEQLLERVWGWEAPQRDTVKTHIRTLRRKLAEAGASSPIQSSYGRGYWLA